MLTPLPNSDDLALLAAKAKYDLYCREVLDETVANNRFIPHTPTPKQAAFLASPMEELLYGGALAGGKSDALLMAAAQYVERPSYRALIIRKTLQELQMPGALIDRSKDWWTGTGATYNDNKHRWKFPSGAEIWFGYLENRNHKYRYQSSEWDFIGFDELVSQREEDYVFLFGRLRKDASESDLVDVPSRMRAASNPPTEEQEETGWWVKIRFVDRGWPYFIPSFMSDNPFVDDTYMERLRRNYDPITFQKLARGDWTVRASGGLFRREWYEIVAAAPIDGMFWTRGWDQASTRPHPANPDPDWTRGTLIGRHNRGVFYVSDLQSIRDESPEVAALVAQTAILDGYDTYITIEQEPGASGKAVADMYRRMLPRWAITFEPATHKKGSKINRATPLAIQSRAQNVKLVRGDWNKDWLDEMARVPRGHDDIMDSSALAFNTCALVAPLDPRAAGFDPNLFGGMRH